MEHLSFRTMTEQEIEPWYTQELCTAFIPHECKPLEDILALRAEKRYELWGLFSGKNLLGYAALWSSPAFSLVLLDYLGVTASRRNGGLGGEILRRLQQQGRPLVTEAELPVDGACETENVMRRRRIAFYERNGFTPAYVMATCGLRWQALLHDPTGVDMVDIMRQHKELYGDKRTDVKVPIAPDEEPELPYWMK